MTAALVIGGAPVFVGVIVFANGPSLGGSTSYAIGSGARSGLPEIARLKCALALDQGTSSSRAIAFEDGAVIAIRSFVEPT